MQSKVATNQDAAKEKALLDSFEAGERMSDADEAADIARYSTAASKGFAFTPPARLPRDVPEKPRPFLLGALIRKL